MWMDWLVSLTTFILYESRAEMREQHFSDVENGKAPQVINNSRVREKKIQKKKTRKAHMHAWKELRQLRDTSRIQWVEEKKNPN